MSKSYFTLNRQGFAPLEMLLALPVVVFLFVLILYVAVSCMQKYELLTLCRNQAWTARYTRQASRVSQGKKNNLDVDTKAPQPRRFVLERIGAGEVVASGDASKVATGLFFDRWSQNIKSQHVVLASPWNYEDVNMNGGNGFPRLIPITTPGPTVRIVDILNMNVQFVQGFRLDDFLKAILDDGINKVFNDNTNDTLLDEEPKLDMEDMCNNLKEALRDRLNDIIKEIVITGMDAVDDILEYHKLTEDELEKLYKLYDDAVKLYKEICEIIEDIENKRETLEQLKKELEDHQTGRQTGTLAKLREEYAEYVEDMGETNGTLKELNETLEYLNKIYESLDGKFKELDSIIKELNDTYTNLNDLLSKELKAFRQSLDGDSYAVIEVGILAAFKTKIDEQIKIIETNIKLVQENGIDKINTEKGKINAEIVKIWAEIVKIKAEIKNVKDEIKKVKDEINKIDDVIKGIPDVIAKIETAITDIDKLNDKPEGVKARLAEIEKRLKEMGGDNMDREGGEIKKLKEEFDKFVDKMDGYISEIRCRGKTDLKGWGDGTEKFEPKCQNNKKYDECYSNGNGVCYTSCRSNRENCFCRECKTVAMVEKIRDKMLNNFEGKDCGGNLTGDDNADGKNIDKIFNDARNRAWRELIGDKALWKVMNDDKAFKELIGDKAYNAIIRDGKLLPDGEEVVQGFERFCAEKVQEIKDIYNEGHAEANEEDVKRLVAELENTISPKLQGIYQVVKPLQERVDGIIENANSILKDTNKILDDAENIRTSVKKVIADAEKVITNAGKACDEAEKVLASVDVDTIRADMNKLINTAQGVIAKAKQVLADAQREITELLKPPVTDEESEDEDDGSDDSLTWNIERFRFNEKNYCFFFSGGLA